MVQTKQCGKQFAEYLCVDVTISIHLTIVTCFEYVGDVSSPRLVELCGYLDKVYHSQTGANQPSLLQFW